VAELCDLTGGQIRNAALLSTLLAEDEGPGPMVRDAHLEAAVRSEYRKAGGISPELLGKGEASAWENDGPVQAFAALLREARP
jgi:hypothetical protein